CSASLRSFSFLCVVCLRDLHSFPTRRSSDLLAVLMIVLILVQHGKGADAGASFGGGGAATVFGASGSGNFMTRLTAILTALFFVDRKSTRLNSSHVSISYAVFCLKKKMID